MILKREVVNRVAAGLRAMAEDAEGLLFLDGLSADWTWDRDEIVGLPVYHVEGVMHQMDTEVLFVPIGVGAEDVARFVRGYEEWEGK